MRTIYKEWLRDEIDQLNALLNVEEEEFPEVQDILQTELEEDEIEKVKLICALRRRFNEGIVAIKSDCRFKPRA